MPRPDTKDEQVLLQNLWVLASTRPDGVTVPCGDESSARRLRFALYNAVKHFKPKDGKEGKPCSQQLADAIASCALSFTPDNTGIVIRQKITTKINTSVLAALGDFQIKTEDDRQADEAAARIMQNMASFEPVEDVPKVASRSSSYGARS